MGQRWLMIDLEDEDKRLEGVKNMIAVRRNTKRRTQ